MCVCVCVVGEGAVQFICHSIRSAHGDNDGLYLYYFFSERDNRP